ncbi:MAG: PAS domain S-box protein [Proteobacteria bacterium]|nr:PAS domain S-box protein [Pseudomonadota bacterium]
MKYQSIFENFPNGVLLMGENFEDCNEQACLLLACGRDDILGHSLLDFSPSRQPDGRYSAKALQQHIEAAFSGTPQSFHWRNCRKDGVLVDMDFSMKAIEVDDRRVILLNMRDITEHKRVEAELRESKKRYKTLAEVSPIGIFHTDVKGNFLYVNERWCQITGFAREEALKKGLSLGLHPEDRERVLEEWCDTAKEGELFRSEFRLVHTDGTISWVYSQVVPEQDDCGEVVGYVGSITDITERCEAERELRERKEFIETITDNLPIGFCVLSWPAGKIQYVNKKIIEILGWAPELVEDWDSFLEHALPDPEYRNEMRAKVEAGRASGDPARMSWEINLVRSSGEKVVILGVDIPMLERNLIIGTCQDITDRKRAEEELRQLNQELEARVVERTRELELANRELEAFTYSVSHDLRGPLRAIDGFGEALLEDYHDKLDEEGKTYLRYLQEGSRDMSELIDGLLRLSRSTRGEMIREPVALSALAAAVAEELHQAEPERQVGILIASNVKVDADPRLLKAVMENLLGNAWKYTGQTADAVIEFGVEEQEGKIVYFVRDNGAGFDMAYADKLFQPFHRLHKTVEFTGIGIGLATVQRIIHRHGGRIWAQGVVGGGATFYFTLEGNNHE